MASDSTNVQMVAQPIDFPVEAVIDRYFYRPDPDQNHFVRGGRREQFRFNLWLRRAAPEARQAI